MRLGRGLRTRLGSRRGVAWTCAWCVGYRRRYLHWGLGVSYERTNEQTERRVRFCGLEKIEKSQGLWRGDMERLTCCERLVD